MPAAAQTRFVALPFASVAVLARWARELPAEIDRRLGSLKEVGEKQVILDIWVLRELLSRLPRMAAERPTRLTKEAGDAPTLVWSKAIKS